MAVVKEQRLQIRIDPRQKRLLERAADATHQNLSTFVLQAASQQAEEILTERTAVHLSPDAAKAFSKALARPATVNRRLAAALGRPPGFTWID